LIFVMFVSFNFQALYLFNDTEYKKKKYLTFGFLIQKKTYLIINIVIVTKHNRNYHNHTYNDPIQILREFIYNNQYTSYGNRRQQQLPPLTHHHSPQLNHNNQGCPRSRCAAYLQGALKYDN